MQIRDAVAAPPTLLTARWYRPLLDLFVRAPPKNSTAWRDAMSGGRESGDVPGAWTLVRKAGHWVLYEGVAADATTVVRAAPDTPWRLLYKALPSPIPTAAITIDGHQRLAQRLLETRSVVT